MCSLTYEIITAKTKGNVEFDKIKKLNCWASNLNDVSLLKNLPSIEVLTLSVNEISTLESIQYCVNLTELYIRNNKIADLNEIFYLKNLHKLRILWLADNPVTHNDSNQYRFTVIHNLFNLQKLDNITITNEEKTQAIMSGKQINNPPSKNHLAGNDDLINISSAEDFGKFIKPLSIEDNHDIVTDLIVNNCQDSSNNESNTLDFTNTNGFSAHFKIDSEQVELRDDKKASNEVISENSSKKLTASNKNGSNVLPAILLLLNELNENDLIELNVVINDKICNKQFISYLNN